MAITIELTPEMEEQFREKATAKGLSVEGYLLTLIEALVQQEQKSSSRLSFRFRKQALQKEDSDMLIAAALRQMRESVLEYKEQAVEAVTKMNMLRSAMDQQERQAAEKELQALNALKEQNTDQAKRLFQEKTILDRHLETVKEGLAAATEAAETVTQAFQQEEERVHARASKAQESALKVYKQAVLSSEQIMELIGRFHTEEEWNLAFEQWVRQKTQPLFPQVSEKPIGSVDFQISLDAVKQTAKEWAKETKRKSEG